MRREGGAIVFDSEGQPLVVSSRTGAHDSGSNGAPAPAMSDTVTRQSTAPADKESSFVRSSAGRSAGSGGSGSHARSQAPQHSFFSSGMRASGGKTLKVAAAAKKAANAAVAAQQAGSKEIQKASKKTYNFPHFDKFAKRATHVDMDVVSEMKEALTPGSLLSSVASSADLAPRACA